jgi:peptidoglycan/xylan/chitin deacetylase (PgdA/CDA1 family)
MRGFWRTKRARLAVLACLAMPTQAAPAIARPVIAVTIDDLPSHASLPPGTTRRAIGQAIIAALTAEHVPARGFVNGLAIEREPDTAAVLNDWTAAGLTLGNHGWSHRTIDTMTAEEFARELTRNEPTLAVAAPSGDWRWFRFPYLAEGEDDAKRTATRAILAARGYRIAAVTMSFGDFAYNDPYARCVKQGDRQAIARLERAWLAGARAEALRSRAMAKALYGRDIPYVLLLHLGGLDARMMPRLLRLYRSMGFGFVSLEQAERDPAYAADLDPSRPATMSSLEGRLTAAGKPVPPSLPLPEAQGRVCPAR